MYRVSIFGLGYVGTVFAACLASRGIKVIGVDVVEEKVKTINSGKAPFYEPGLSELIEKSVKQGFLEATTDYIKAVTSTDISVIFVGTPSKPDGSADLKYVESAAKMIGEGLKKKKTWHLIVVRSTVPPGTTEGVVKPTVEKVSGKKAGEDFGLCMNPEFTKEGSAVHDTFYPSRIVIGEYDKKSGDTLEELYRKFHENKLPPILRTNIINAELIKYASNAFLATKISFINTIANICQKTPGADVNEVAKGMGLDPRISPLFLRAGLGFGGSCFPKDLKALIAYAKKLGYTPILLEAVLKVNEEQPLKAVELAKQALRTLKGKNIAVLGLAFKPGTDDIREAVSLKIIEALLEEGAQVVAHDPKAMENTRKILGNKIKYAETPLECIKDADCAIIVTEWPQFKQLKPSDYEKYMKTPVVIDGRRLYSLQEFKNTKVVYKAVGLGT